MEKYRFSAEQRSLLERMTIPLAVFQYLEQRIVPLVFSKGFCAMLGYEGPDQAYLDLERDLFLDIHDDDKSMVAASALRAVRGDGHFDVVYRTKQRNGPDHRIIHAKGEPMRAEDGTRLEQVWYTDEGSYSEENGKKTPKLNDVFSRVIRESTIARSGRYDSLTGLPRTGLFSEMTKTKKETDPEEAESYVLLFLNFSGLKFYNHRFGFPEGNRLLAAFAGCLSNRFGSEYCSRLAEDHFVALAKAEGVEGELARLFRESEKLNGGNSLPVRVGICRDWYTDDQIGYACDRAKDACDTLRNNYASGFAYYDPAMRREVRQRQEIQARLERAISEKWIQVHYQPIIRAASGKVCNEEALARWYDPKEGLLTPDKFIPYLEDSGQIHKLDLYVVEQVLEKQRMLQAAGYRVVPLSVNLSRADFAACDMVEEIRRRADEAGVDRSLLAIEITESTIGSDFERMKEQIARFRALGFPVWLDDFGSGYSSLDALQSIPFDMIKFDMSFMRKLGESESSRIVLTELLKLAAALGADTVCEGVETEEQVRFLQELGCSKLQGYYFGKPIPLGEVLERYEKGFRYGFENPDESPYFEAIGRVNLHDMSMLGSTEDDPFRNAFSTLPMGIIEVRGDVARFVRSNQSYRDFIERFLGHDLYLSLERMEFEPYDNAFMKHIVETCCRSEARTFFDEELPGGAVVHSFARRISVDPLDGTVAVAVAVLSVSDSGEGTTYAEIARALAADYYHIYYVDLNTERYIEYSSPMGGEGLAVERHGEQFFEAIRQDARKRVYAEDLEDFQASFTKENILRLLDEKGVFTTSYRLLDWGEPRYVSMKLMRMHSGEERIIIGINVTDEQPKRDAPAEEGRDSLLLPPEGLEEEFQRLADLQEKACSILSVEKGPDGTAGEIRIVRANRAYKEAMGMDQYYDNMPYYELVPKVQRFENSCYRCAIEHQQLHSYLQTRGSSFWTDQMLIPLRSEREDLGYCMFVMEMSQAQNREQLAAVAIHTASTVLKASIALMGTNDLRDRVETVLGDIMEFSEAFSVRILLVDHPNRRAINYCNRMAEEISEDFPAPPEDPDRAVISYPMICSWEDTVGDASSLVVTSPDEMDELEKRNPAWARSLRPYQVERLILVPLRHDREITGYLYLCNFNPSKTEETREVSELLSFFLSTEIYNEVLLERLDDLSHTDALTGLNNRNAMIQRTGLLAQGGETLPFGVVNLDLNGLKRVNDDFGHEAGDRLLVSASEMLKKHFYQRDLYRTGGDEFIVIATGITREAFERKVERLRKSIKKDGSISFAIGACWSDGTMDVPAAFRRADELMYEDKKAFYEQHPEQIR